MIEGVVVGVIGLVVLGLVVTLWYAVPSVVNLLGRIAEALEELVDLKKRGR